MRESTCPYSVDTRNDNVKYCRFKRVFICDQNKHPDLVQVDVSERFVTKSQCSSCGGHDFNGKYAHPIPDFTDPGMAKKAFNFLEATRDHVRTGRKLISEDQQKQRWDICEPCGYFDSNDRYCTHKDCGCKKNLMTGGFERKITWLSAKCPIGKWPSFEV